MSEAQNLTTTQASATTSSLSAESITGIVFGICATLASFVTIWQAHRAWKNRHKSHTANQKSASNTIELSEAATFATQRSSSTTAGASFIAVPEARITQANEAALPRVLIAGHVPPIAAQSQSTKGTVSLATGSTPSTTRLSALRAALDRLGLPTHEVWDPAKALPFSSQSSNARESAVRAAMDGLTSAFDLDESGADPSELVGHSISLPSTIERGDEGGESSSRVR